jgi:predicted PhzF superfamily epimerase YddE/YHI9
MYVKAVEGKLESSVFRYKTKVGVLPFEITKTVDDYKVIITQGKIEFEEPFGSELRSRIISSLKLDDSDIDERCPARIVSTGHS